MSGYSLVSVSEEPLRAGLASFPYVEFGSKGDVLNRD